MFGQTDTVLLSPFLLTLAAAFDIIECILAYADNFGYFGFDELEVEYISKDPSLAFPLLVLVENQ